MNIAHCIGCGCDDDHACVDYVHGPCFWVCVDYEQQIGVCSSCQHIEGINQKWFLLTGEGE